MPKNADKDEDVILEDLPAGPDLEGDFKEEVKVDLSEADNGGGKDDTKEPEKEVADDAASLREQLRAAQEREADAVRRAEQAEAARRNTAAAKDTELADTRLQVIANSIAATEATKKQIQQEWREARETGNYDAEAEANDKLSQVNLKLTRLTEGKNALESEITHRKEQPADPFEAFIKEARFDDRAAGWARQHRDVFEDPVKFAELNVAHHHALRSGVKEGTDDYYAAVETELGLRQAVEERAEREEPKPRQQRAPAAPSSRSGTEGVRLSGNTVILSAAEREAARIAGISDLEYARQKQQIAREAN